MSCIQSPGPCGGERGTTHKSCSVRRLIVVHAFNPDTWKAEADGALVNSRSQRFLGQPELHSESLSQQKEKTELLRKTLM